MHEQSPFHGLLKDVQVIPDASEECVPPDGMTCTGGWHFRDDIAIRRCDTRRRAEIRARVAGELKRLAGPIEQLGRWGALDARGVPTLAGYDPTRHTGAPEALAAMLRFASGRPPRTNVLLKSSNGLGKTRMLLASHFALLEAGVSSVFTTTPELRFWFRRQMSFDEEIAREARSFLEKFTVAQAVHFDDPGHVENDQRARGEFTEGLKHLLDCSRGAWAVATNRSSEEMESHPDLSGTIASRFQFGAEIVVMSGLDFRVEKSK
jgi:hypothetical protein